jgi:diguanylate cyclase (GGDEF)-like protein
MPDDSEAMGSSRLRSRGDIPTWGRFQGILLATIAVLAILVLIFGGLAIEDSVVFLKETRQMERLVRVHQLLDRLLIDILEAETGQRGFLLTGEIAYLRPYLAANAALERDLTRIQKSDCEDPVFRMEMPVVTALLKAKRDEISRTIRIRNTEGLSAAIPIIRSNFGIIMMQLIEFHIANINRSIHRNIGQVRARSEARKHASERHAAILIAIFLLVLIGEYVYFWKSYRLIHLLSVTLEQEATHDPLTGLPNRTFFYESLKLSLGRLERGIHSVIVLYLDLDRFKEVNDQFGHEAGDRLLVAFSKRLLSLTRKGDLVARIGGDEFTIILDLVEDPAMVLDFVRMFEKRLTDPPPLIPEIGGIVDIGVSIGWAIAPKDGMSPDALLMKADKSMYQVKEEHRKGGMESFR